jgi:hypothetical protein
LAGYFKGGFRLVPHRNSQVGTVARGKDVRECMRQKDAWNGGDEISVGLKF